MTAYIVGLSKSDLKRTKHTADGVGSLVTLVPPLWWQDSRDARFGRLTKSSGGATFCTNSGPGGLYYRPHALQEGSPTLFNAPARRSPQSRRPRCIACAPPPSGRGGAGARKRRQSCAHAQEARGRHSRPRRRAATCCLGG